MAGHESCSHAAILWSYLELLQFCHLLDAVNTTSRYVTDSISTPLCGSASHDVILSLPFLNLRILPSSRPLFAITCCSLTYHLLGFRDIQRRCFNCNSSNVRPELWLRYRDEIWSVLFPCLSVCPFTAVWLCRDEVGGSCMSSIPFWRKRSWSILSLA